MCVKGGMGSEVCECHLKPSDNFYPGCREVSRSSDEWDLSRYDFVHRWYLQIITRSMRNHWSSSPMELPPKLAQVFKYLLEANVIVNGTTRLINGIHGIQRRPSSINGINDMQRRLSSIDSSSWEKTPKSQVGLKYWILSRAASVAPPFTTGALPSIPLVVGEKVLMLFKAC